MNIEHETLLKVLCEGRNQAVNIITSLLFKMYFNYL